MEKRQYPGSSPEVLAPRKTPRIGPSSFQTFEEHPSSSAQSSRHSSLSRPNAPDTMGRTAPHTNGAPAQLPTSAYMGLFPKALEGFVRATSRQEQRAWKFEAAQNDYEEMAPKCRAFPAIHSQTKNKRDLAKIDFDIATVEWKHANESLQDALEALEARIKASEQNIQTPLADFVPRAEYESLKSRLAESDREHRELTRRLEHSEADVKRLDGNLNVASSDAKNALKLQDNLVDRVRKSEDTMNANFTRFEKQTQQDRVDVSHLKLLVGQHTEKLAAQTNLIDSTRTDVKRQVSLVDALRKEQPKGNNNAELNEEITKSTKKLHDAIFGKAGVSEGLMKDVDELLQQFSVLSHELSQTNTRINVQVEWLDGEGEAKDVMVGQLIEELQTNISSASQRVEDMNSRVDGLSQKHDGQTLAINLLERRYDNLTTQDMIAMINHQWQRLYGPMSELMPRLEHIKVVDRLVKQCFADLHGLGERVRNLGMQKDAQPNLSHLDHRLQHLDGSVMNLRGRIGEITEDLTSHKAQMVQQLVDFKDDIAILNSKVG